MENTMATHRRSARDLLTIKLRNGGTVELRGTDIPSLPALLMLFKRRKLKAKVESLRTLKARVAALKESLGR